MIPSKKSYLSYLRSTILKETEDHGTYFFHPPESSRGEWIASLSGNSAFVVRSIEVRGFMPPRFETRLAEYCNELPKFRERVERLLEDYLTAREEYEKRMNKYKEAQIRKAAENFCE